MKKSLLFLTAVFAGALVQAQITVTSEWMATVGDTVFLSEDTIHGSSLNLGSAAGGQTWDFSTLVEHEPDGAILESPSSAPLSSNFPDADFVVNDLTDDSIHIFFSQDSTAMDVVGIVEYDSLGNPALPEVSFGFRFMQFPATMGTTFTSSAYAGMQTEFLGVDPDSIGPHPTIDSIRSRFYFIMDNEIDAWGELELPQGTFLTVRQRVQQIFKVSSDCYINGSWQPFTPFMMQFLDSVSYDSTEVSYRWWSDNPGANFMIAELSTDTNGDPENRVSYYKGEPEWYLGVDDPSRLGFEVFPNPASDVVQVRTTYDRAWRILLFDIQGKQVLEQAAQGNVTQVNMDQIHSGVYLMQITDANGRLLRMEKIIVAH